MPRDRTRRATLRLNLADLAAQLAACRRGAERLLALVADHGAETVRAFMAALLDFAESAVRQRLKTLADGAHTVAMDNGARVAVAVTVDRIGGSATIDFAGTSAQLPDNFNAPPPGRPRRVPLCGARCCRAATSRSTTASCAR